MKTQISLLALFFAVSGFNGLNAMADNAQNSFVVKSAALLPAAGVGGSVAGGLGYSLAAYGAAGASAMGGSVPAAALTLGSLGVAVGALAGAGVAVVGAGVGWLGAKMAENNKSAEVRDMLASGVTVSCYPERMMVIKSTVPGSKAQLWVDLSQHDVFFTGADGKDHSWFISDKIKSGLLAQAASCPASGADERAVAENLQKAASDAEASDGLDGKAESEFGFPAGQAVLPPY